MSAIRRAKPMTESWSESLSSISSAQITDVNLDSTIVTPLLEDGYPYPNQTILQGTFTYLLESPRGEPTPVDMGFSYRTGSRLFILNPGRRDNLSKEVLFELRSALTDEFTILPSSSISLQGIWNFIQSAYEIREVKIKDSPIHQGTADTAYEDYISYDELPPEEVIGKKKVRRADLAFYHQGVFNVLYSEDLLSVQAESNQFEYAVQKFEKEAIFNG